MAKPKLGSGERFKQLSQQLKKKGVEDPDALAAAIGRKKYGKKKFQKMAAAGESAASDLIDRVVEGENPVDVIAEAKTVSFVPGQGVFEPVNKGDKLEVGVAKFFWDKDDEAWVLDQGKGEFHSVTKLKGGPHSKSGKPTQVRISDVKKTATGFKVNWA